MSEATKNLQDELKDSAHRIWLAGLGALAAAGEEGTKMFDRLVDRGREYEARGKDEARKQYEEAKTSAEDTWKNWGDKLDESVTKALHRMGVPSRDEIHNLTRRVEELNAKVEMLKPRVTPAGIPIASKAAATESAKVVA
jgi:poly(hydroxyalkanoate) granule-associated protein